jgi:glycosyltransferase involved in cell wall biosynthesis
MVKESNKILFLYYDPHYAHAAFAKALHADFWPAPKIRSGESSIIKNIAWGLQSIKAIFTLPRDYDIYFCEGTYIFPAIARKLGFLPKNAKIINILASPLLYYIKTGRVNGIKRWIALEMLKEVDSFVCIGKMEQELLKEFLPKAKFIVAYPFIRPEVYGALIKQRKVLPKLDSHVILTIGTGDVYYKGIDIVVEAFKIAKKKIPDLKLNIVGKFDDDIYNLVDDVEGIEVKGYVKDLVKEIKNASLYVHMGRGDTFPVSVLEAMLGGLPVIVSNQTGTKEFLYLFNKNHVLDNDAKKVNEAIMRYFSSSNKYKIKISKNSYKLAKSFEMKVNIGKFVSKFKNINT